MARKKKQLWLPPSVTAQRTWWRAAVQVEGGEEGEETATLGKVWSPYDIRAAYFRAWRKHKPSLSPHGLFRELRHGRARDAEKFLRSFGPLTMMPPPERAPYGFHTYGLKEFWSRQLRFRLIAGLWESRSDKTALLGAWRAIAENHERTSFHDSIPLGFTEQPGPPHAPGGATPPPPGLTIDSPGFPWVLNGLSFERWAMDFQFAEAKRQALRLVRQELEIHTAGCTIAWENGWEPTGGKFRPITVAPSLLTMIWEFLGLDSLGLGWRRCPHCQKMFYPKRCDQFYCTVRQQALASKRHYAARRYAEEKRKKNRRK